MTQKHKTFLKEISSFLPSDRIYTDELRRFAWGTDASFYRLNPQVVVRSSSEEEISKILSAANRTGVAVTFRAAGTSLSGQSVSDSVLVVAGKNWEKYRVSEDRKSITLQPGLTGGRVNKILAEYGRKFGPDPASVASAMVGGIVANNASGMSCGTHANSDKTLISVRIVLADGTVLDTADPASRSQFMKTHPGILGGLSLIRKQILEDETLAQRVRQKYSIKNVTGLNLRPFLDYEDTFDIIAHLMVGSEGTLAFLSEVTMATLPTASYSASAMVYFTSITDAAKAVVALKGLDLTAAEMLDKRSLASVKDAHAEQGDDVTALLLMVEADDGKELEKKTAAVSDVLASFTTLDGVRFSTDKEECAQYWAIRSGIFPTVGGMRQEGTTCLIEDVAFRVEDLPSATADLSALLDAHGYSDSCIYGHALEGNFHFILNQAFDSEKEVARYESMIRDVCCLVVEKYDGSLKAEHGTGRNMAPFVEYEWGKKAYDKMKKVKELFDPNGLLNPGVIFNDDPECFIKSFKSLPVIKPGNGAPEEAVEAFNSVNKCIECGFCEINCVSCGLTLSSRTRIAALREITALEASQDKESQALARILRNQYRYFGEVTCAGDGLCSTSCPMHINVADMTHELRRIQNPPDSTTYKLWNAAANNFPAVKSGIRAALSLAQFGRTVLGDTLMSALAKGLHALRIPLWTPSMPGPYKIKESALQQNAKDLKVVYFPSCFNQMMGSSRNTPAERPLAEEMIALLSKSGYEVIFPEGMKHLCCGTIWESKGMPDVADRKTAELEDALWKASCEGKYPVLCDQSPCLHRMRSKIRKMELYEPAEFIWKFLRDRLVFTPVDTPVAVHTTCSTRLMGLGDTIVNLAGLCSTNVIVPEGIGCCGYAGDKGMQNPELNAWALRKLKDQIEEAGVVYGYSNSRTCELGLHTNSGIPYLSIVYLVNSVTKAK